METFQAQDIKNPPPAPLLTNSSSLDCAGLWSPDGPGEGSLLDGGFRLESEWPALSSLFRCECWWLFGVILLLIPGWECSLSPLCALSSSTLVSKGTSPEVTLIGDLERTAWPPRLPLEYVEEALAPKALWGGWGGDLSRALSLFEGGLYELSLAAFESLLSPREDKTPPSLLGSGGSSGTARPLICSPSAVFISDPRLDCGTFTSPLYMKSSSASKSRHDTSFIKTIGCLLGFLVNICLK